MKQHLVCLTITGMMFAGFAPAQQKQAALKPAAGELKRTADGHPDLSGTWIYAIDLAPVALKKEVAGKVSIATVDHSGNVKVNAPIAKALPSQPEPSYKPQFQAKVKDLFDHEGKTDPVFYCGRPGVPRIGPPRRIVQMPNEMLFLYEDASGDTYRVFPTDGRKHRADANPSYYGDSVGHWEGDVLVVDVTSFVEDGWFGEGGYFHTDKMHVTERIWRDGENLAYQAIVEDPGVLTAPWTMAPRLVKPTTLLLEESPACKDEDGAKLLNNDHHGQR
ncbi:MAG TPA: hypothetical protein VGR73_04225 [Bryobacteraceae bacterium]|nr:hypothetical protein [Bryobacteraceae bacterium]